MSFPQLRVKRQSLRRSLSKRSAAEKWPPLLDAVPVEMISSGLSVRSCDTNSINPVP
jgi:hypothetical protein